MQKLVLFISFLVLLFIGCSKDKFQTTPSIKIKSIRPTEVPNNAPLVIDLEFTDKQGDLDSIFITKTRINQKQVTTQFDLLSYGIPEFPAKTKGEIQLTIDYNLALISAQTPPDQTGAPNGKEPDSLVMKIVLKDKAKNVSDTLTTGTIVVERF